MATRKRIPRSKSVKNPKAPRHLLRRARKVFCSVCALADAAHELMLEAGRLCDSLRIMSADESVKN